jgi:mycothiol synthase
MLIIRPSTTDDYAAIAEINTIIEPEHPDTAEDLLEEDRLRDPKCRYARFVAEKDGVIVGHADHNQFAGMYHPQKFILEVTVLPAHRQKGIGSALWDFAAAALQAFNPISIRSSTRENRPDGIQFLAKRGYVEEMRTWENRLALQDRDLSREMAQVVAIEAQGYRLVALSELEDDGEMKNKLFSCFAETRLDVPRSEPASEISFEQFHRWNFESKDMLPQLFLVAIAPDGEYVATTALWKTNIEGMVNVGLTGTRRNHRNQGLATALKLKAMILAQAQAIHTICTWNASTNQPMLSINERLGFVKQPAWIEYQLSLEPQTGATDAA